MRLPWRRGVQPPADATVIRRDPGADPPASDPDRVFDALHAHDVRYVAIGGIAVQAHGHPRTTRDVDVLTDPAPENIERLARALKDLGAQLLGVDADLLGIDPTDPHDLASGANFTLTTNAGRLDVFTDPAHLKGSPAWEDVDRRALSIDVGSPAPIRIVGLDDLLQMKSAAGRDRDLKDIAALTHRNPPVSDSPDLDPGPERLLPRITPQSPDADL